MPQVSVNINRRSYRIACEAGQEAHLTKLADFVDKRVGDLVAAVGQIGDTRLMVMTSLLIADELSDLEAELETLREGQATGAPAAADAGAGAAEIEAMAGRIEAIAAGLEDA